MKKMNPYFPFGSNINNMYSFLEDINLVDIEWRHSEIK